MTNGTTEKTGSSNSSSMENGSRMQGAGRSIDRMSRDAGAKVGEFASDFADSASGYIENSRHYVQGNPGKSVAIAVASGVLTGALITLAMCRRN